MTELDDQTESLVQQLYDAWSTNADPTSYLNLRDQLLSRRERVDTCIATLKTVITVTCPQIIETERFFDPKWEELFALAEAIEEGAEEEGTLGKRKRSYNEVHRLRNLAVVSALWSPSVVRHYGWNSAAQGCMRLLKTCALRFPDFGKHFCPYLNRVLLERHCEAIVSGRLKTLNEAPLQCYRDLNMLVSGEVIPNLEIEELWVSSSDGVVPVDSGGRLLKDVRPYHFQQHLLRRDHYGMLIARGECQDAPLTIRQDSDFTVAPPAHEEFLAQGDSPLAPVQGLTFTPTDMFTPSGMDSLMDGLAFNYQTETLPYGANGAVDLALNPDDINLSDEAFGSEVPEEYNAESSINSDLDGLAFLFQADRLPYGPSAAATVTLPREITMDPASNLDEAPTSDITFISDLNGQNHAESEKAFDMSAGVFKNSRRSSQQGSVASLSRKAKATRLQSSSAKSRGPTGASANQRRKRPTMEDELRANHDQILSKYTQKIHDEALPGYDQRQVRSQWLTQDTRWARIWSSPRSKGLPPGTATSKADCDVIYCSVDDMLEAARSGEVFLKPVIIKESFSDAGMHNYERFLSLLEDASSSEEKVEIRCIDINDPINEPFREFTAYLRSSTAHTDGLWMSTARSVAKCHRPLFTMLNRFRLLESLSETLHDHNSSLKPSPLQKAMSVSFNVISFPGAFSGAHLNNPAGSWQRNLSGVKFWLFVPESDVPQDELAGLGNEGSAWLPQGRERLVVLEENDVLFVPPGLRLVQAWHTPTTCLVEQGMLWDDLSILSTLKSMPWGRDNKSLQDDRASQQLFRMMNNLDCLIREQPDRFRRTMTQDEFINRVREACQLWLRCSDGPRKGEAVVEAQIDI